MFGDFDWPINTSRRFVSDSWVSCTLYSDGITRNFLILRKPATTIKIVIMPLPMPLPLGQGALSDDARLTSVAYIRPKSRTERLSKIEIGTGVAHVTRDSDTTFKVKRSACRWAGHIVAVTRTACFDCLLVLFTISVTAWPETTRQLRISEKHRFPLEGSNSVEILWKKD